MTGFPEASETRNLRLSLACDLRQVRHAAREVRQFLARNGCDDETLTACDLALVEACNNAIQHAPGEAKAKPVRVEALCEPDRIELRITDHTAGFNWPERVELPASESESGRGLFLIQSLMDSANYFRGRSENVLVLRKARSPAPGSSTTDPELSQDGATSRTSCREPAMAAPIEPARNGIVTVESEIAGTIHRAFLLDRLPDLHGIELAAFCRSAHQFGGDFYDVLKTDDDSALLVIADVMGKGALAALFAAILRTAVRAMPEMASQPAALLDRVNRLLFQELSTTGMFITAQLVYLEPKHNRMTLACAGHCPLLLGTAHDGVVKPFSPDGMPLGILPDTAFSDAVIELKENCRVLIYTDGVTEAINASGERYGQDRLMNWLERIGSGPLSAEQLKRELVSELKQFRGGTALADDQTFLMAVSKPSAAPLAIQYSAARIGVRLQ